MAPESSESSEIQDTDIVFECPFCQKSLAIDHRGAGLTIACPDCDNQIQVPIPEGMELFDFDSTDEEQEIRIIHMRELVAGSQARIHALDQELQDLKSRRETLERLRTENHMRFEVIGKELEIINRSLHRIAEVLETATEAIKRTEPPAPPAPAQL